MATPVQPSVTNTHVSRPFGETLEPGLRKIFFDTLQELPEEWSKIFHVMTSSKAEEKDWGMGSFKGWTKRTSELDTVAYEKLDPGLERSYKHEAFTDGFIVGREWMDDEQYRVIAKFPAGIARAGRMQVEKDTIQLLNNGFKAANAIYDGQPLFSDAHPLVSHASKTGKNLLTGPLNEDNLKKALIKIHETLDEAGNPYQIKPLKLIIPPALVNTAEVLLKTVYKPGGNDNDVNVLQGKLEIVPMTYLGLFAGGSDTAWFIQCDYHEMNFFWRVRPEFKWEQDFDTFVAKYRGYMRYSFGVSDWRGIYGSTGV